MSEKQTTYTVLHDKGERVGGKNIRPYETFKAVPTKELDEKVKKGYLREGSFTEEQINSPETAKSTKKSTRKGRK